MGGHRARQPRPHVGWAAAPIAVIDGVGLGRQRQVDRGLREVDPGLGQADELDRLGGRDRRLQGRRVGQPMSSLAWTMSRRAMNRGSSPASIIRAR